MNKKPFFIIGCVRSGTTLLRDILRMHPNLASPEETHFFRWSEPFGTKNYLRQLANNPILKKHRKLDGITEVEFQKILKKSSSRSNLCSRYMWLFIRKNKPEALRWFDKTPQNVYGAAMIASAYPGAKFLHIVRNPMDVVASLRVGKIMKVENIIGACSYWNEAAEIIHVLKRAYPRRVYEVKYETFTSHHMAEIEKILKFLGEDFIPLNFENVNTVTKKYDYSSLFSNEEIQTIENLCSHWRQQYGFPDTVTENESVLSPVSTLGC